MPQSLGPHFQRDLNERGPGIGLHSCSAHIALRPSRPPYASSQVIYSSDEYRQLVSSRALASEVVLFPFACFAINPIGRVMGKLAMNYFEASASGRYVHEPPD